MGGWEHCVGVGDGKKERIKKKSGGGGGNMNPKQD